MKNLENLFSVAIVGRPNVGKSTLFNRLCGKKLALTDDIAGVTRDRKDSLAKIADLEFKITDTAGLENIFDDSLESRMRSQTEKALQISDLILFVIDSKTGLAMLDYHFAKLLRSFNKNVILLANKSEGKNSSDGFYESYSLGLGDPIPISAEHNEGMIDLYEAITPYYDEFQKNNTNDNMEVKIDTLSDDIEDIDDENIVNKTTKEILDGRSLKLTIVGRPNAGKSTLINSLLGEDRLLTGAEAGITRDSISIDWKYDDVKIQLVDTAGLRKKSNVWGRLERMSVADTNRSINFSQIVILLLDANLLIEKQDLTIAQKVIEEGRGLVLVINKWDTINNGQKTLKDFKDRISISLPQVKGVPIITISAKTGRNLNKIIPSVFNVFEHWNSRVSTSQLNRWLINIQEKHPAPLVQGKRIKIKYGAQTKIKPPTFTLFTNKPTNLPQSYIRYISNGIREQFNIKATPIRIHLKKGKNPYANE